MSVLNGQLKSFETIPVECTIENLDGKTSLKVTAFTTGKVAGYMRPWIGPLVLKSGHI